MQLSACAMASSDMDVNAAANAAATCCDLNGNATTTTRTAATATTQRKDKTILGWLVKSASVSDKCNEKHNHSDNDNDNDNNNRVNNCNCETRTFRGVQTLRLLWSKRIQSAAGEEAATAAAANQNYYQQQQQQPHSQPSAGLGTLRKLNKSVSCLVNAFNNARDWPSSLQNAHETRAKRAASLHNLQETHVTQAQLQRDKDNFNKYKNAEQAKMQCKLRRHNDETTSTAAASANASFPAVKSGDSTGERFLQWPKRGEVMAQCKAALADYQSELSANLISSAGEQLLITAAATAPTAAAARPAAALTPAIVSLSATSTHSGSNESLQTINSRNSTTSTTPVTSRETRTTRRKYSFKTHAGKSYTQHHTPRRMTTHSHTHQQAAETTALTAAASSAANSSGCSAVSQVRQLTQKFNEIIQKDARLLEQVKRKSGVWLSRGSHVYKIVEKPVQHQQDKPELLEKEQLQHCSTVQRNIKKFEKLEKPALPKKPQQLQGKPSTLSLSKQMRSKRAKLQKQQQVELEQQQQQVEPQLESPIKLHVVREETVKKPSEQPTAASPDVTANDDVDNVENVVAGVQSKVDNAIKPKPLPVIGADSAEQLTQPADDSSNHELDELELQLQLEERQKQRKHKYATIYEKLRFLSFPKRSPEKLSKRESQPEALQVHIEQPETGSLAVQHADPQLSPCVEADYKILVALEVLNQKLKVLSEPAKTEPGELLPPTNDDFEERLLPNNSFIYQAANKQISNNQLLLNQAVNVTLVNGYEGEKMIMEQKQLQEQREREKQREQQQEEQQLDVEPMYEPIRTEAFSSSGPCQPNKPNHFMLEDIYQTVEEANTTKANSSSSNWLEDYESIAGFSEASNKHNQSNNNNNDDIDDDYEPFETPTPTHTPIPNPEEPAAPLPQHSTGTLGRNMRDELPELPKPKRVLPKSPIILRPAPAKPNATSRIAAKAAVCPSSTDEDEDGIYDTIKDCYDSMAKQRNSASTDAISLSSNCYESISTSNKITAKRTTTTATTATTTGATSVQLSSSGSSLTISSDHRTNSIYESSVAAGFVYGTASVGCRSSLASSVGSASGSTRSRSKKCDKQSSVADSTDNSDAWVDISDGETVHAAEAVAGEAQFIVVRERVKQHRARSPDWSKRIRDKRLQQNKAKSCHDDDSDHYYETLSPLGNKRHSTQLLPGQHHKRNQDLPRSSQRRSKQHSASAHALGQHAIHSDDYDSFETDSDEHTEQQPQVRQHNDSGVDMHNLRLPETPASQNQVYAIVRRIRNYISNKKSPKVYENTQTPNRGSQFYVECKNQRQGEQLYELGSTLSNSEKNLIASQSQQEQQLPTAANTLLRCKQKNAKSLRSRLRKSLVGSSIDTKQLSTLTPARSTFYIEDPVALQTPDACHGGSGELDSGFSEKTSSGDIPVQTSSVDTQQFCTLARKSKKESKVMRRRTTSGLRPVEPPPPPPEPNQAGNRERNAPTSWYAECGVFKQSASTLQANDDLTPLTPTTNGNSWYAESGLYQPSGISVASSSGSSGVSTGNEAGLGDEQEHSLFSNEPLYQVYSAAKLESITRDLEGHESSTDGYEEIAQLAHARMQSAQTTEKQLKLRPSALQLIEPKNGPSRTLWSEVPEVIHSCILPTLTPQERGLQEAKFEIMTSEASYLKSLNLLRRHFMNNSALCDTAVLSARDRKALFSYIVPVHECSERLLTELENCWQDNIMLLGLSRCIYEIAERHFHVYITFCEHQGRMDRTLRRLKEVKNGAFQQHLDKLESSPNCCGLNLHSFLMLPMQRITRLPLLIDAVFSKESAHNTEEYEHWKLTLALVQKIVAQCNEAANRWEQAFELERISKQLEFPSFIRALAIAPVGVPKQGAKPRFLVKRGDLTHLIWRGDDAKLTFGKRFTKSSIYAFLFSDLLVLCKRKGESTFTVFDYCPRSMLTLTSGDALPQLPTKDLKDPTSKNLMLMTLLENYERKTVELVLSCPSVSDQQRWLEAMRPPEAESPGEKLYESWDCPQVVAKRSYESDEPDALQLELGDVINVSRKVDGSSGWYHGERIRDGAVGWFPGSYTEELNSAHVRARNLKQRHRLLTFSANYLETQKGK